MSWARLRPRGDTRTHALPRYHRRGSRRCRRRILQPPSRLIPPSHLIPLSRFYYRVSREQHPTEASTCHTASGSSRSQSPKAIGPKAPPWLLLLPPPRRCSRLRPTQLAVGRTLPLPLPSPVPVVMQRTWVSTLQATTWRAFVRVLSWRWQSA